MKPKIVVDTNVIITALRSKNGASHKLVRLFGENKFIPFLSVALILEYEDVIRRHFPSFTNEKIDHFLDYICAISQQSKVYYLWRPHLKDPADDMVLELAVASNAKYIVTYNQRDFKEAKKFGIKVITPKDLLKLIGEMS